MFNVCVLKKIYQFPYRLKQIVEFSLDTVPPLVEKLEIPSMPEDDDANAIGVVSLKINYYINLYNFLVNQMCSGVLEAPY